MHILHVNIIVHNSHYSVSGFTTLRFFLSTGEVRLVKLLLDKTHQPEES